MATDWAVKELITAVKMNQTVVPKYTRAEQEAVLDANRLAGMVSYNKDKKALNVYQAGTGSTFNVTELSNFLYRNDVLVGIGSTLTTVHNEAFVNNQGKMNTRVFVIVEYLPYASLAYEVRGIVTDGVTPVNDEDTGTAGGAPSKVYKVFEIDTSSFTLDDILNVKLEVKNAEVQYVEFRGV